jgi:hypothetical protein
MQVICIDDSRKPKQIPQEKWIRKGQIYTVIGASHLSIQKNKIGLKLKEIELDQSCFPYEYFDANRFKPTELAEALSKEEVFEMEQV